MRQNKDDIIYDLQRNFNSDMIGEVLHVHPVEALQGDVYQNLVCNDRKKWVYVCTEMGVGDDRSHTQSL